jgi:hypothetical protein
LNDDLNEIAEMPQACIVRRPAIPERPEKVRAKKKAGQRKRPY